MVRPPTIDYDVVRALFAAGNSVPSIASKAGVGERRIRQVVCDLRPGPLPVPDDAELDTMIVEQRKQLGANYGIVMMEGALHFGYPGLQCSRRRIAAALQRLYPAEFKARVDWAVLRLERAHYDGHHFMHSVHLDFDGKFQEYGLHVGSMVEGVSRAEMALVALTTKIPIAAYLHIFLPFVLHYGFPDQLITDKGKEWVLIAFVCHLMHARYRPHVHRPMHHAVEQSKFNTRVEKFNFEINVRCFIPLRLLTNAMEATAILDKLKPLHVGAFSTLMQPLLQVGLDRLAHVWNHHRVRAVRGLPGSGGRPCDRALKFPNPTPPMAVPVGFDGVAEYEAGLPALRREPEGAPQHDALYGQLAAQQQRAAGVANAVGGATHQQLWEDILAGQYRRFITGYVTYLQLSGVSVP